MINILIEILAGNHGHLLHIKNEYAGRKLWFIFLNFVCPAMQCFKKFVRLTVIKTRHVRSTFFQFC